MFKFALIGNGISYSLSPKIYNYWFKMYDIKATYILMDIPLDTFSKEFFTENIQNKFNGCNITKPYKEVLLPFLTEKTPAVQTIGAVNTIHFKNHEIIGYNTDYLGLIDSFAYYNLNLSNKNILIFGAGGAAKSLIYALNTLKLNSSIYIYNRSVDNLAKTKELFPNIKIYNTNFKNDIDVIFNATTLRLDELFKKVDLRIKKDTIIYNLNYNNNEYIKNDLQVFNGIYMLLSQAAYNFKIWFNQEPIINDNLIKYFTN